jgi:hypothetical protein
VKGERSDLALVMNDDQMKTRTASVDEGRDVLRTIVQRPAPLVKWIEW